VSPAELRKIEADTVDDHANGIWKGWVHHGKLKADDTLAHSEEKKYLIIDGKS
jgi:hypothetical protein